MTEIREVFHHVAAADNNLRLRNRVRSFDSDSREALFQRPVMSGWLLAAEAVTSGKRRIHKSPLKSSSVQNYSVNIRQLDYMQALSVSVCVCVCVCRRLQSRSAVN